MKVFIVVCFAALTAFHGWSQKQFKTSMSFTFSNGNNCCGPIGNDCGFPIKDVDVQYNPIDGTMDIIVQKTCHSWSLVQHWMGGPYAPSIVFKNRYLEFRIKSIAAPGDSLSVGFQVSGGFPNGGKSIPKINYTINEVDTWETKFFNVGGNADTVFKEVDYSFPNGYYQIDYIYYGDAAVPPLPLMDSIGDQARIRGTMRHLDLTGIQIPQRVLEGLRIEAKTVSNSFLDSLCFENGKNTCFAHNSPLSLSYKISDTSSLSSDTVLITLTDTLRGTSNTYKFKISTFPFGTDESYAEIKVFPTLVNDAVTIDFTEFTSAKVDIINITGNVLFTKNIFNQSRETIDLSNVPQGVYLIKIAQNNNIIIKKILKL